MNHKYFLHTSQKPLTKADYSHLYHTEITKLLGVPAESFEIKKDSDGMPYGIHKGKKLFLSFSHSELLTAGIVATEYPVGIDIQKIRPVNLKILNRICSEKELSKIEINEENFFKIWTIKEAALKCIGLGFQYPAKDLLIDFENKLILLDSKPQKVTSGQGLNFNMSFQPLTPTPHYIGNLVHFIY